MNPYQQYDVRLTVSEMEDVIAMCVGKPHMVNVVGRLKAVLQRAQVEENKKRSVAV